MLLPDCVRLRLRPAARLRLPAPVNPSVALMAMLPVLVSVVARLALSATVPPNRFTGPLTLRALPSVMFCVLLDLPSVNPPRVLARLRLAIGQLRGALKLLL